MRRELIYRGRILDLVRLDGRWEVVEHAPAVVVLVQDGPMVLGVRQRRPAIGETTWELPAGLIESGEEPLQAARRELAEEAGLDGELTLVTRMFSSPGFTDELIFLFEARRLRPASAEGDEDEELEVHWLDAREAWREVAAGRLLTSGPSLVGLGYALSRL